LAPISLAHSVGGKYLAAARDGGIADLLEFTGEISILRLVSENCIAEIYSLRHQKNS
jgi:hypothetical protein